MDQIYLQRCRAQLVASAALGDLGQVVYQPLKYISSVQVTVIIHINIHHTLGICERQTTHTLTHRKFILWRTRSDFGLRYDANNLQ